MIFLSIWQSSCALFNDNDAPLATIPPYLLAPVSASDVLTQRPTVRLVAAQALEYRRALGQCSIQLDAIREFHSTVDLLD